MRTYFVTAKDERGEVVNIPLDSLPNDFMIMGFSVSQLLNIRHWLHMNDVTPDSFNDRQHSLSISR